MIWRLYVGAFVCNIMLWVSLLYGGHAYAQSTTIYQDDFEGTVSGWSDNSTDFDPDVTNFLGRFASGQTTTSRTFTVPANSDELIIGFDLYRFDSWDNNAQFGFDRFELEINGTEIFSLPFPNPQAARSGTTGNVDWSHSPLTGTVELAFTTGQFWFDQLHRFEVIVNNPGTSVTLTLRAALTQGENDEAAGFDNFLVTAEVAGNDILAVAESFAPIDGTSGGATPSVLTSDTINGAVLNPNDVTITSTSSSSANVTLNPATGLITVTPNTPAGVYTVDYEICENISLTNCSSVTETVSVFVPGASGGSCPAGTNAVPGLYHVLSATGGQNPNRAVGAPLAEGSVDTGANSGTTFFPSVIYDLTNDPNILVPAGTVIEVSLARHFNGSGQVAVSGSLDNTNFPNPGSADSLAVNLSSGGSNTFIYFDYTVPSGGARFIELDHQSSGVRFDGVIFDTLCTPPPDEPVEAEDDNGSVADSSLGTSNVLNVLDNDTIGGATPTVFDLALAPGETLPSGVTFDVSTGVVEVLQNTPTGVLSFDYQLCQAGVSTNCDIATVTINVTNPNPPSVCPPATSPVTGTFNVASATGGQNPNRAVGPPLPEGSVDTGANSGVTFFPSVIYDLTNDPDILVPEGTVIDVSLARHFNDNGQITVSGSLDNTNFPNPGSVGSLAVDVGSGVSNSFVYFDYTVPSGGVRFLELDHQTGGIRFDGVIYDTQCQTSTPPTPTSLSANKTVAIYDPQNLGLYAIPGNDVIYTISVDNTGTGDVDPDSVVIIDNMPPEIVFFNGDIDGAGPETNPVSFQDTGGGLTFTYNSDVGFSNAATDPTSFANCTYVPIAGYDPDVTFICINPKGVLLGQSNVSISFRARIE